MRVLHEAPVDLTAVGREVKAWLEGKGFQTEEVEAPNDYILTGRKPADWRQKIGASPSLRVSFKRVPGGTEVDMGAHREAGRVWAARYFTGSWVAAGVSFLSLKHDVEELSRQLIEDRGGHLSGERVEVIETHRIHKPLGRDERVIDNSDSDATVAHTLQFSRRWRQSCTVQESATKVTSGGFDLSAADVATLSARAEDTLQQHYSLATEVEQAHTETVTLTVPARTAVRLIFDWKTVTQTGVMRMTSGSRMVEVPFEADLGLTFDQRLDDMR